jgi:release factor glutamine methyltransferase
VTTVDDLVTDTAERFARVGIVSALADAELLVGFVTGWTRGEVSAKAFIGAELNDDVVVRLDQLVVRREAREPLQHITGQAPFRYLVLDVGPGVLVPRPETELVAEWAIDALRQVPNPKPIAVDLGTGTGALALALSTEVPYSQVYAVEKFEPALKWARKNIESLGDERVTLVTGDAESALPDLNGTVDVVVANPPYIPDAQRPADHEVIGYDPESALFGGEDGLRDIRTFIKAAARLLHKGGVLILEHGDGQGDAVRAIAEEHGFRSPVTHLDLLHRERALTATL